MAVTIHGEGFPQDASGSFSQVKLFEFVLPSEGDVGHIAASASFAGNALAKVVDDYVVELWAASGIVRNGRLRGKDPVKNLNYVQNAHFQTRFFQQFTRNPFLKGFADFERAAGNRPMAA